jgi:hypothetical protein
MGASLRDPHRLGDITEANAGIVRDAEQDLSVVREELVLGHLILGYFIFSLFFWPAALIVAYVVEDRTTVVQNRPAPTAT